MKRMTKFKIVCKPIFFLWTVLFSQIRIGSLSLFSDIDECAIGTHECVENSSCENEEGGYRCECHEGFRPIMDGDELVECKGKLNIRNWV